MVSELPSMDTVTPSGRTFSFTRSASRPRASAVEATSTTTPITGADELPITDHMVARTPNAATTMRMRMGPFSRLVKVVPPDIGSFFLIRQSRQCRARSSRAGKGGIFVRSANLIFPP